MRPSQSLWLSLWLTLHFVMGETGIDSDETSASTGTGTSTTLAPRDHIVSVSSSVLLEQVNLNNQPMISDANFKTLVRHCLKSRDPTACDSMKYWDISKVKNCDWLFWEPKNNNGNDNNNHYGNENSDWVLLKGADTFNVDISRWNTSSCTTMKSMFNGAAAFDQDIGNWNTHRVTDMSHMFQGAKQFNKDISKWKTDNVLAMSHMFRYASRFHNPDLSYWDTSRVTDMSYMFASAAHFNGKLNWNVARVQHFQNMFHNADLFDSYIGDWNVGGAIDDPTTNKYGFVSMFEGARDFNQDLSHWEMSHARNLDFMFKDAHAFSQDLSHWNIEEAESLKSMFTDAKAFDQILCWDLNGKAAGNIFEGTAGGSAMSNVEHCWEMKQHSNNNAVAMVSPSSSTNNDDHDSDSDNINDKRSVLKIILLLCLVAISAYWVALAGRHFRTQKTKQELEHKISRRASRAQSESSSRSTYDDDEDDGDEYFEEDSDSDQEDEIVFYPHGDAPKPKESCFQMQMFYNRPSPPQLKKSTHGATDSNAYPETESRQRRRKYVPGLSARKANRIQDPPVHSENASELV